MNSVTELTRQYALLVPCYNAAKFVEPFLQMLSKVEPAFNEVIFYDDASTDNTVELLHTNGVRVIKGEVNRGPGHARNKLAAAAASNYIHFHDIDDILDPSFLSLADHALAKSKADILLGSADWVNATDRTTLIAWRYDQEQIDKDPLSYFITHPLGVINTIYAKHVFLQVNGFNEEINCWEDADIHVRLGASGASFTVLKEVLAYSLRHEDGISRDQSRCWGCRIKFLKTYLNKYLDLLGKAIFTQELEKAKNALISLEDYRGLKAIISLVKEYQLPLNTKKITLLYLLSKCLPAKYITRLLRSFY